MTESVEGAEVTETTPRRGRPRPESTKLRDSQVLEALGEPKTRAQLVDQLGLNPSQVYLSLWRLHKDGQVTRTRSGGDHVWALAGAQDETVVAE